MSRKLLLLAANLLEHALLVTQAPQRGVTNNKMKTDHAQEILRSSDAGSSEDANDE